MNEMDETPEMSWLRFMLESECLDWKELSDEKLEELLDDWCAQAEEDKFSINEGEFRRQAVYWVEVEKTSR